MSVRSEKFLENEKHIIPKQFKKIGSISVQTIEYKDEEQKKRG